MDDEIIARPAERSGLGRWDLHHVASSGLGAFLCLVFASVNISASVRSGRVIGLGLGLQGVLTAVFFFIRRPPRRVSGRTADWLIAFGGAFGFLLVLPGGSNFPWTDPVGLALQGLGVLLAVIGLGALGRSFGIVAADRGIVTSGPYRVVRHPMYAAQIVSQIGYLIQSPRLWNVSVLVVVWLCQVARIMAEERLLAMDAQYHRLMEHTRWRLVPGLW